MDVGGGRELTRQVRSRHLSCSSSIVNTGLDWSQYSCGFLSVAVLITSQLSSPPGTGSAHCVGRVSCLQHEYSSQTLSPHSAEDVQEEWRGEETEEDQQAGGSQRQAAREAGNCGAGEGALLSHVALTGAGAREGSAGQ